MSVKLSELKVPENCPYFVEESIGHPPNKDTIETMFSVIPCWRDKVPGIAEMTLEFMCANMKDMPHRIEFWRVACAVAALYWRKAGDDKRKEYEAKHANDPVEVRPRNSGKATVLAEAYAKWSNDPLIVESRAAMQQADRWQRAAFEGVEQ